MGKLFFTPGPSQLYPTLEAHIRHALEKDIGSISHRGKKFEEIFFQTVSNLRALLKIPQTHHLFFLSSGTEAMERIIENCVEEKSYHFVNGSFSKRFFTTAQELKKQPEKYEVALGEGFDFSKEDLRIPKSMELVCLTHNETSTGVMTPIQQIHALKKLYPEQLFALDVVSSAPYPELDFTLLDCVFFSVQKLFGLFAGLCVLIVSPKAFEKSLRLEKKGCNIGSYHNFPTLAKFAANNQTPETPPILHMYLLNQIVQDMQKIGLEVLRKETDEKAKLLYSFFDALDEWSPAIRQEPFRSPTVLTIQTNEQTLSLKKALEVQGLIVGGGYGPFKDSQIRIANFPAISLEHVKLFLNHMNIILKSFLSCP